MSYSRIEGATCTKHTVIITYDVPWWAFWAPQVKTFERALADTWTVDRRLATEDELLDIAIAQAWL